MAFMQHVPLTQKKVGVNVSDKARQKFLQKTRVLEPDITDGSVVLEVSNFSGGSINFDLIPRIDTVRELVTEYRAIAAHPDVDTAIDDIVNEAITTTTEEDPVVVDLDGIELSEDIKRKITEEWEYIAKLLDLSIEGYDLFRGWYEDGRVFLHIIVKDGSVNDGIRDINKLDPRYLVKIKEVTRDISDGAKPIKDEKTFFVYDPNKKDKTGNRTYDLKHNFSQNLLKIDENAIAYAHSGIMRADDGIVMSHLEKVRKPLNNLKVMEDAVVIYRITRAPERRIFYVDVGSLPTKSAGEYLKMVMKENKTNMSYDVTTGKVKSEVNEMHMLEDFWMPRREGSRGTEVDTLQGGQNLGEIDDLEYFLKRLYKSLNVPFSRLQQESMVNLGGRAAEITRDELKFSKFINRLRRRFSEIFYTLLGTQIVLKGIMTKQEWLEVKDDIKFVFAADSIIEEQKEAELIAGRMEVLKDVEDYIGRFFSAEYVMKRVLRMTDEDIEQERKKIEEEKKSGVTPPEEE